MRIAAIATAAERLLLPLLARFRRVHPRAAVTVQVGNRTAVVAALRDGDADLVVAGMTLVVRRRRGPRPDQQRRSWSSGPRPMSPGCGRDGDVVAVPGGDDVASARRRAPAPAMQRIGSSP